MSTQHVESLTAGEARLSVLTNKQGRVVELVHHLALADDEVLLLGAAKDAASVIAWLEGFLFVEDVSLEERAGGLVMVAGQAALEVAESLVAGSGSLAPWQMSRADARLAVRTFDLVDERDAPVPAVLLWAQGEGSSLVEAAEASGAAVVRAEALEGARVAAGVPAAPGEVSERYNPLELGLHDAIHWAKGCYIGQEVIARIDNYGKQARQLVGLSFDDAVTVAPGASVFEGERAIGELTSVAPAIEPGRISALAVIKARGEIAGRELEVQDANGARVASRVERRQAEQRPHD